jgi:hypothetical protein
VLCLFVVSAGLAGSAWGQAAPTATAGLQLSAFAGATGDYTGLAQGRNLSITAGVDATFRPFFGLFPTAEVRGTYPIERGSVDGQKNVLGGLTLGPHLGWIHPYGDVLVGRGEIDFSTPYPNPSDTEVYVQTASTVISPGAGANLFFTEHFAVKADFQFQHYDTPVTSSGSLYSKALTVGITYRLPFSGLAHGRR